MVIEVCNIIRGGRAMRIEGIPPGAVGTGVRENAGIS